MSVQSPVFGFCFALHTHTHKKIPASPVLPYSCTCVVQVIIAPCWGRSSTSSVSCERTGRTRFRPSRWPSFSASYCTCPDSHFSTTLTSAVSSRESKPCLHLQMSQLSSLFDTLKSLQTGQRWLRGSGKLIIKSFRQEQMHPGGIWMQLQLKDGD